MAVTGLSKYHIWYGFLSGPMHAHRFSKLMGRSGYAMADGQADIAIAHSAGCWLVPGDANPKLMVYVGMPLTMARAKKSWVQANVKGLVHSPLRNIATRLKNTYYGLSQLRRNLNIYRHPHIGPPNARPNCPVLFIANRYDPWPQGEELQRLLEEGVWAFVSLPGAHDDIWEHPDRYVELIDSYATRLLA